MCRRAACRSFDAISCYFDHLLTRKLQACLNAPEPSQGGENGVDDGNQVDSPEEAPQQHMPPQGARQQGMPQNPHMPPNYMPNMGMDPSNLAYGGYVGQQRGGGYPMGQSGMPQHAPHQS